MTFKSNTYGATVYDESNYVGLASHVPAGMSKGYEPRDWAKEPFGSLSYAEAFPKELYIPREEWAERCEELERRGDLLSQICQRRGVRPKDQNGTNYCWINCVVAAMESSRARQGLDALSFSPASAGGPIKGYSNVGGWPGEGVKYIAENGVVEEGLWPANAISRQYDNAETRENRKLHTITKKLELPEGDFDAMFSLLLRQVSVPIGLIWWRHAIEAVDPVVLGRNDFGIRIKNSWGENWEQGGYGLLRESKARPDDAVAVVLAV